MRTGQVAAAWAAFAAVALAGGCTSSSSSSGSDDKPVPTTAASPRAWTEPADYGFVLQRRCEGRQALGTYRVTVRDRAVTKADRIDGTAAIGEEEIDVPTLGGLLELARTAADDGGTMSTSADPVDGHPVTVSFDVSENGDNAEDTCFHITEYAPAS